KSEQKQLNTWVSFQSAEQPLLGQFSVSDNKNGLKKTRWRWFSADFAGAKKRPEGPDFNDLQTSMELCRS
ncbi:hypothetical protein, partial [Pseudomonas avellanae]